MDNQVVQVEITHLSFDEVYKVTMRYYLNAVDKNVGDMGVDCH
jgi:hypothetical protein